MSAGDESNGAGNANPANVDTAEIYEPPYLFRGPAPDDRLRAGARSASAAASASTRRTTTSRAPRSSRPAAVTHGVDMNQRVIQLDVDAAQRLREVDRAGRPNAAPPGYYMLFLLNDQGVPSVAKFVKLQAAGSPAAAPRRCRRPTRTAPSVAVDGARPAATVLTGSVKLKADRRPTTSASRASSSSRRPEHRRRGHGRALHARPGTARVAERRPTAHGRRRATPPATRPPTRCTVDHLEPRHGSGRPCR